MVDGSDVHSGVHGVLDAARGAVWKTRDCTLRYICCGWAGIVDGDTDLCGNERRVSGTRVQWTRQWRFDWAHFKGELILEKKEFFVHRAQLISYRRDVEQTRFVATICCVAALRLRVGIFVQVLPIKLSRDAMGSSKPGRPLIRAARLLYRFRIDDNNATAWENRQWDLPLA